MRLISSQKVSLFYFAHLFSFFWQKVPVLLTFIGTNILAGELFVVKNKKELKINSRKALCIFKAILSEGEYLFNGDWMEWDPEDYEMAF
jgi:hypothetical protein